MSEQEARWRFQPRNVLLLLTSIMFVTMDLLSVFESLKSGRVYAGWWDRVTSSAGSVRAALIYTLRPNIERCLVRSSVGSDEFIAFSFHSSLTYIHWPSDHKLTSSLRLFLNLKSRPMASASRVWHHLSQIAFHSASCQNSCVWMAHVQKHPFSQHISFGASREVNWSSLTAQSFFCHQWWEYEPDQNQTGSL